MLFTKKKKKKYILGIDLEETFCQLSYLNTRRFSAGMDPHTFSYIAGREEFNIPSAAFRDEESGKWAFGKEALDLAAERGKEPLTCLLTLAAREEADAQENAEPGQKGGGEGKEHFYGDLLTAYLKYCLTLLSVEVTVEETEAVTFTTAVMDRPNAVVLRRAVQELYPGLEKVAFEEHLKSFYHYVLMQDEEQRRQSVLLVDGWSGSEPILSCLSFNKKTRPIVCFPEQRKLAIPQDAEAGEKDRILYDAVKELMKEKEFSAAYLTGELLAGGWMKDSLNLICRGRRAFQGDNLYSKGAAYSTLIACGMAAKADKFFYLSTDALRCNIGMACLKKGRMVYQALLDAGSVWYDAASQIDILLEDGDEITLMQTPVDRGNPREITVKLENMPRRPRAATRLRVKLSMKAVDLLWIEVEDMGFGEIFPSSGMRWEQEIAING